MAGGLELARGDSGAGPQLSTSVGELRVPETAVPCTVDDDGDNLQRTAVGPYDVSGPALGAGATAIGKTQGLRDSERTGLFNNGDE